MLFGRRTSENCPLMLLQKLAAPISEHRLLDSIVGAEDLQRRCSVVRLWRHESVEVWLLLVVVESLAAVSASLLSVLASA